jgi:hypothetical protein
MDDKDAFIVIKKVDQELIKKKVLNFNMYITDGRQVPIKLKFVIEFIGTVVIKP